LTVALAFALLVAVTLPFGLTPAAIQKIMTPLKGHPAAMPADTVPFEGCVPAMGYHYARAQDVPFGPFYGYYNGKAVFTEVMVAKSSFDQGRSFDDLLKPLPGYAIDHVDVWFEPFGHPGYRVPHYDIHAWYVPHAVHMKFCGNASGKRPPYL